MKVSKFVSFHEATYSPSGEEHGVKNIPDARQAIAMTNTANHIVDKCRAHYKKPAKITSFFRSPAVNGLVGGASNSQHVKGEAVDFFISGVDNKELAEYIRDNLDFDQVILEYYNPEKLNKGWVHCSYKLKDNRKSVLTKRGGQPYAKGIL